MDTFSWETTVRTVFVSPQKSGLLYKGKFSVDPFSERSKCAGKQTGSRNNCLPCKSCLKSTKCIVLIIQTLYSVPRDHDIDLDHQNALVNKTTKCIGLI